MRTFLSLVLVASLAGCLDGGQPPAAGFYQLTGTWVPRSERPTAYDCDDDTSADPGLWGEDIVNVHIDDGTQSGTAGTPCAWAGFWGEFAANAKTLHVTFTVVNKTYAYPPMTVDVPGPFHGDVDLGHVAIVPSPRSSP